MADNQHGSHRTLSLTSMTLAINYFFRDDRLSKADYRDVESAEIIEMAWLVNNITSKPELKGIVSLILPLHNSSFHFLSSG